MASSTTILAFTILLIFHLTPKTILARPLNDPKPTDGVVTTITDEANNLPFPPGDVYTQFVPYSLSSLESSSPPTIPGFPGFRFPFPFPFPSSPPEAIPGFPGFRFPFPFPSSPPSSSSPPSGGIPGFPGFRFPFPFPFPSSPPASPTPPTSSSPPLVGIPGFPGFRFPFPFPFPSSPPSGGIPGLPNFPGFRFPPIPFLPPPLQ